MSEYRVLTADAGSPEWLRLRKTEGIGASESAAVLGDTSWGTPLTIWQEKTSDEIVDHGTERMRWGQRMEPIILDVVREEHPDLGAVLPSEGLLQSVEHPHLLGTLDSMIDSPNFGQVPLEVKNVSGFEAKRWRDGDLLQVPPKYAVQVRQQAFIRGDAPGGYVAALFDGNHLEMLWVPRSQRFIDEHLTGTLADFWHRNVLGGLAPDPILGDDLASLWPAHEGEEVEADDTFLEMRERWIDAKGREKTVKKDLEVLKHYFGVYFEHAEVAVDADAKPVMRMATRSGSRRVSLETHADNHPECKECVRKDRDSRFPLAILEKAQPEFEAGDAA